MTEQKIRKTAAEKAQEDLDRAVRKVARLEERGQKLYDELQAVGNDLDEAKRQRDYIAQHPALTQPTVVTVGEEPTAEPVAVEDTEREAPAAEPTPELDDNGMTKPTAVAGPPF